MSLETKLADAVAQNFGAILMGLFGAVSTVWAWLQAKARERKKVEKEILDVRIELAKIKFLLSAATELDVEQLTLDKIKFLIAHNKQALDDLTLFVRTCPLFIWIKRREGPYQYRMIQVSNIYAEVLLGASPDHYRGKTDAEIWGESIGELFNKKDEEAYIATAMITEDVRVTSPLTGFSGRIVSQKWSFTIDGRSYVCGIGNHIDLEPSSNVKQLPNDSGD